MDSVSIRIWSEKENPQDIYNIGIYYIDLIQLWELVKQFLYGCCFCVWGWSLKSAK